MIVAIPCSRTTARASLLALVAAFAMACSSCVGSGGDFATADWDDRAATLAGPDRGPAVERDAARGVAAISPHAGATMASSGAVVVGDDVTNAVIATEWPASTESATHHAAISNPLDPSPIASTDSSVAGDGRITPAAETPDGTTRTTVTRSPGRAATATLDARGRFVSSQRGGTITRIAGVNVYGGSSGDEGPAALAAPSAAGQAPRLLELRDLSQWASPPARRRGQGSSSPARPPPPAGSHREPM